MTLFITSVAVVLIISALCSLTEAGFYAVRRPYLRRLAEAGSTAGRVLLSFKENMERPIAAILIVNTAANTAGAAVAGAQARYLFGEASILWFSALFTLAVLFLSEILPKVVGVVYNQSVSRLLAVPWAWIITVMHPLVWFVEQVGAVVKPSEPVLAAPEEEVEQMAMLSAEEGSIMNYEAALVRNVLKLDKVKTRDIMTPRPVVVKLPDDMTLRRVAEEVTEWVHTRIPIYASDDPETWTGFVMSRDILAGLAGDRFDAKLGALAKPLYFVSEDLPGHVLLKSFLRRRVHLFGVIDEYGDITGIVTLEDVLESLIGEEIVDEADTVADLQELARRRKRELFGKGGPHGEPGDRTEGE
jgi:CBS domain containing-hemolysin-like protein